jgi:endonuclease III
VRADKELTQARDNLISIVRELVGRDDVKQKLAEGKLRVSELNDPEFVWYELLLSVSIMGNSRGKQGLIDSPDNFARVQFKHLERLNSSEARLKELQAVLHAAKVRMPDRKAQWLSTAFDRIAAMGGPTAAKLELLNREGRAGKIDSWREFDGIGEKYSRNIMMDVYHPEFRNSIAVDARIKKISKALGLSFKNYDDAEQFFLSAAQQAGIEGWELDRIMYRFLDEFVKESAPGTQSN